MRALKRLLGSRIGVAALVALAVAAWAWESLWPARSIAATPAATALREPEWDETDPIVLPKATLAARRWTEPPTPERLDPLDYTDVDSTGTAGPSNRPPVLRAISVGPRRSLAVLDHEVLGEGESLGDWLVERIEPDRVTMLGPEGSVELRLLRHSVRPETDDSPSGVAGDPEVAGVSGRISTDSPGTPRPPDVPTPALSDLME